MQPTTKDLTFTVTSIANDSEIPDIVERTVFQITNFWAVHPDHPVVAVDKVECIEKILEWADNNLAFEAFQVCFTFYLDSGLFDIHISKLYLGVSTGKAALIHHGKYVK